MTTIVPVPGRSRPRKNQEKKHSARVAGKTAYGKLSVSHQVNSFHRPGWATVSEGMETSTVIPSRGRSGPVVNSTVRASTTRLVKALPRALK